MRDILRNLVDRSPSVALAYRNLRDLMDTHQPAIKTPWGFTLAGHKLMASGLFEPKETALVRELLKEVDLLVNVGANVGYYCCHALEMGKKVVAVEPIYRNLHYLLKNIRNNGWSRSAEIYPVALGAQTDILEMWGGGTGASLIKGWSGIPESYVTRVPVLTLDRLLGSEFNGYRVLIIVDVEGAEYPMLQGAKKVLRSQPAPIWMMEIASTPHQPQGLTINPHLQVTFETFFALGYHAISVEGGMRTIIQQDISEWVNQQATPPGYNFVFRK